MMMMVMMVMIMVVVVVVVMMVMMMVMMMRWPDNVVEQRSPLPKGCPHPAHSLTHTPAYRTTLLAHPAGRSSC